MIRDPVCAECGEPIEDIRLHNTTLRYCSNKCRFRARDRARYARDPDGERAKSRVYYAKNRERVIARVKAQQAARRAEAGSDDGEATE